MIDMDIENMLTGMIFLIVPIVAILIYATLTWETVRGSLPCQTNVTGSSDYILGSIKSCAEKCWSKHSFGRDTLNDDCYTMNINLDETLGKSTIENFFSKLFPLKAYFNSLNQGQSEVKVRYNSTAPEISLVLID